MIYKNNRGQALLIAVAIIGSLLMGIITATGYLSIQRIRTSRSIINSGTAIMQADAGIEWALNQIFAEEYFIKNPDKNILDNGDVIITKITGSPCRGYHVVSTGTGSKGNTGTSYRSTELTLCL